MAKCKHCKSDAMPRLSRCQPCAENQAIKRCHERARARGHECTIDAEWLRANTPDVCPCCAKQMRRGGVRSNSPSIDRADNRKGYTPDNCWVICFRCNRLKSAAKSPEELFRDASHMRNIGRVWREVWS